MQAMRQSLYIAAQVLSLFTCLRQFALQLIERFGITVARNVQSHRQQSDSLTDVVVKLASDSRPFLLVCLDESLIRFGKSFFGLLDMGDVLGEEKNSSLRSVRIPPRTNFPAYP